MIAKKKKIFIYGKHVFEEALKYKPEALRKAFLAPENRASEIYKKLIVNKIPVSFLKKKEGKRIVGKDAVHQGYIGVLDVERLIIPFEEFLKNLPSNRHTALVLLDELTDPQNVGAIIRSAGAFGIQGILLPLHRQSGITSTAVKVSAGMIFVVPIVEVKNVNSSLDVLREKGFKIVALDEKGNKNASAVDFKEPILFILGNENYGIRQKTLEKADEIVRIPISPNCDSLNVATAGAIMFYLWYTHRI